MADRDVPFASAKQPVERGIPLAEAGGVMSRHRPLAKSFLSSLQPCALRVSNTCAILASPASRDAPVAARMTATETLLCALVGHAHMPIVSPFDGPSGTTRSLS